VTTVKFDGRHGHVYDSVTFGHSLHLSICGIDYESQYKGA